MDITLYGQVARTQRLQSTREARPSPGPRQHEENLSVGLVGRSQRHESSEHTRSASEYRPQTTRREPVRPSMAAAGDTPETVEVTLRAVGPSRPTRIRLPPLLTVSDSLPHSGTSNPSPPSCPRSRLWCLLLGRGSPTPRRRRPPSRSTRRRSPPPGPAGEDASARRWRLCQPPRRGWVTSPVVPSFFIAICWMMRILFPNASALKSV
jgi:hypothetical protein